MKKLVKYILCTGLAAIALAGCKKEDGQPAAFALSSDRIEADPEEGLEYIIVSAPGPWKIEGAPQWCTVTPAEWSGSREISIGYTENTGASRQASLSVVCGDKTLPIEISQEGKNLAAAPTNVKLYAKSTSSLTFSWDDVASNRTYTVQCASEPSEDATQSATYSYTWTTKSTSEQWPYDFPTRFTFLSLTDGGDKLGSADNMISPGKTYWFRVRCGGADDEAIWSEWVEATTATRTPAANEIFHEDFDRACVGGGDWLNQAAGARTKNDVNATSIWNLQWDGEVKEASKTYGNYYIAANFNPEVYQWIGYTRIWDRGDGKGDIQPCPGYTKCGNSGNPGVFRILALGSDKLSADGDAVQLSFKATPWAEVTTGAGYTIDNKHVSVYVNDTQVAGKVLITDTKAESGNPAVLTDMVLKTVTVDIPNLKPEDTISIKSDGDGKGRFFIDEISIVKK